MSFLDRIEALPEPTSPSTAGRALAYPTKVYQRRWSQHACPRGEGRNCSTLAVKAAETNLLLGLITLFVVLMGVLWGFVGRTYPPGRPAACCA